MAHNKRRAVRLEKNSKNRLGSTALRSKSAEPINQTTRDRLDHYIELLPSQGYSALGKLLLVMEQEREPAMIDYLAEHLSPEQFATLPAPPAIISEGLTALVQTATTNKASEQSVRSFQMLLGTLIEKQQPAR